MNFSSFSKKTKIKPKTLKIPHPITTILYGKTNSSAFLKNIERIIEVIAAEKTLI